MDSCTPAIKGRGLPGEEVGGAAAGVQEALPGDCGHYRGKLREVLNEAVYALQEEGQQGPQDGCRVPVPCVLPGPAMRTIQSSAVRYCVINK